MQTDRSKRQLVVVVEFASVTAATACHAEPAYRAALSTLLHASFATSSPKGDGMAEMTIENQAVSASVRVVEGTSTEAAILPSDPAWVPPQARSGSYGCVRI